MKWKGELALLNEKAAKNPNVSRLYGTPLSNSWQKSSRSSIATALVMRISTSAGGATAGMTIAVPISSRLRRTPTAPVEKSTWTSRPMPYTIHRE